MASSSRPPSLPEFLKLLTSQSTLSLSQAMQSASKLLPRGFNTLESMRALTQVDLAELGIDDEAIRKGLMALIGKGKGKAKGKAGATGTTAAAKAKDKRTKSGDVDDGSMIKPPKEAVEGSFDFDELEAEEAIVNRSVVVNRSPVMSLWAFIVLEQLGFARQEALSIAHVFTELNATSKGVSLGILPASDNVPVTSSAQPYIDLMGRKVPVMKLKSGEWRGLSKGQIADPSLPYSYVKRAFRQQLGSVTGALRLLASSFTPDNLNRQGYSLYCDFRPDVASGESGWGAKAAMKLKTILDLRPHAAGIKKDDEEIKREREEARVNCDDGDGEAQEGDDDDEPKRKKVKLEVDNEEEDKLGQQLEALLTAETDEFDDALNDGFDNVLAGSEDFIE